MTAPRRVEKGRVYLITRRCTQRSHLLRSDPRTEQIFLYCLAEAAQRLGIVVIAWVAMSNHYHAVVEDPDGRLPEFLARLNRMLANALNAHRGRRENLWATEQASAVLLVETADVLDKTVYALMNPVTADLVDCAADWPGASSFAALDGGTLTIARPPVYFRRNGSMPESVTLVARPPSTWPHGTKAWADLVRGEVRARERAARRTRIQARRTVLGATAATRLRPDSRPRTRRPRRGLRPQLACGDPVRRAIELAALRTFRLDYADARARTAHGKPATFPRGTYKLVREGLVRVSPDGPLTRCGSSALPP